MLEVPRAVPILGWRICCKIFHSLGEDLCGFITGDGFERQVEGVARFVPATRAIGREPLGIAIAQYQSFRGKTAFASHDLEHRFGTGLADNHQPVDLANLDRVAGGLILLALLPLMAATALAIKLDSPGPVLFRQRRHGFNNEEIEIFKFRSLRHDHADPDARQVVTRDDPRVTRVGRFIRKTSIDELPQLVNVLRGELSLVGPRPHAVEAPTATPVTGVSSASKMFTSSPPEPRPGPPL